MSQHCEPLAHYTPREIMIRTTIAAVFVIVSTLTTHPASAATTATTATTADQQLVGPEASHASIDRMDGEYFKGYATDAGKIITSPLRWEPKDWVKFSLVIGGTGALFLADKEIKNFSQRNRNSVATAFSHVGNAIGDPLVIFPATGAFYLYGQLADDSRIRRTSLLALESLVISGALTEGIKRVAGRPRPEVGESVGTWHGPVLDKRYVSFSSGHTASAFAVATVVAHEYGEVPYVAPAAYSLATLTALSRIYSNKHWASDTLFGAALGHFVSKAVLSYHKDDKGQLSKRLSIAPQVGKEMTGLTVNYQF